MNFSVFSVALWLVPWVLLVAGIALWRIGGRHNEADWGGAWSNRIDGLNRWFCRRYHRLSPADTLPLPEQGPALLVANHVSGLDPLLLVAASRRPLRFIIAREQYERFGLKWLFRLAGCIPVDRERRPERAFREALRMLAAGEVVAIFPHGTIHLDADPPRPLKAGVARLASLGDCPVYPVRIEGIAGEGEVLASVFRRSRARLRSHPPVNCHQMSGPACLEYLAAHIGSAAQVEGK